MTPYERLNREMDRMLEANRQKPMAVRLHDVGTLQRAIPHEPVVPTLWDHVSVRVMGLCQTVKDLCSR